MESGSNDDNWLIWLPAEEDDKVYPGNPRKIEWINYKGGKCQRCGYSECVQSMTFHHTDSTNKKFGFGIGGGRRVIDEYRELSRGPIGRTREEIYNELDKCILLCFNCHQEFHAGKWKITELISPNRERQLDLC